MTCWLVCYAANAGGHISGKSGVIQLWPTYCTYLLFLRSLMVLNHMLGRCMVHASCFKTIYYILHSFAIFLNTNHIFVSDWFPVKPVMSLFCGYSLLQSPDIPVLPTSYLITWIIYFFWVINYLDISMLVLNVTPGDLGEVVFIVGLGMVAGGGALTLGEGWVFTEASTYIS